jgi:integrase-like protein
VTFHGIRHTFASLLVTAGVPLAFVAEALGHSDTRMVSKHYAHFATNVVHDAIHSNLPNFGVKTSGQANNVSTNSIRRTICDMFQVPEHPNRGIAAMVCRRQVALSQARRVIDGLANTIRIVVICLPVAGIISCGQSRSEAPGRESSMTAEVVVTFDGPRHSCTLSIFGDTGSHSMPCVDITTYLTKTLKLRSGSSFDYKTIPDVDVDEFERVISGLKAAGYQLAPGAHVGLLTEPK